MEVLDEFDSEFPQSVTFCQLISEEDFERQVATYTERALRLLFRSLDRSPALAEKAKVSCAVQGELNCCNSMGALEMHQRLEQLKRRIHRVYLYSQSEAPSALGSSSLADLTHSSPVVHRRLSTLGLSIRIRRGLHTVWMPRRREASQNRKPEPILLRDRSTFPCLPPTLLPPPATTMASMVAPSTSVYTLPRVFGPFPPLPSTSVSGPGRGSL
ncbi:uncharacterized protein LOC132502907 isoform X2 [Mesoplodon densirostris]|uniref:uncharacterized protein LOC132502907 isoform X2 n=1 Tax=Mesoplodon densirostris TaxID=48708 RepID=UPI0028DB1AA8|nr:uncharacterized protein LOC132502907 isoform X2 [Mesoplodon densirostris]